MNTERSLITNQTVNQAIEYIQEHAAEELTLEDVAGYCHFSKYYFDRLFKAQTGESVYAYIKRVRLEQSAFCLKTQKRRTVTSIGADYGYSASNYSSAFREHYRMSPIAFRRKSHEKSMRHPFFHHEEWQVESFEACDGRITVEEVPDYYVIYERRFGSYDRLSADWTGFISKYQNYLTGQTRFLERTWDDPSVTQADKCLYDVCMSVGEDCPLENTARIRGGKCAVYHFKGHAKHIYAAYQTIFLVWMPGTSYRLDESRSVFDVYYKADCGTMNMELDICLPIC